jgi:ADP-ribose pyrophosphatase
LEKTLKTRLIHEGRHFSFLRDEVELPDGRRTHRDIVRHPGAVAIVPLLPDGRIVLVRQYRYAAGKALLEIPAGTLEPGESHLECAIRELREETGYKAEEMEAVFSCYMAPGYSSEVIHFYVARGLVEVDGEQEQDEAIDKEILRLSEVLRMIGENTIEDAKTFVGVLALEKQRKLQRD